MQCHAISCHAIFVLWLCSFRHRLLIRRTLFFPAGTPFRRTTSMTASGMQGYGQSPPLTPPWSERVSSPVSNAFSSSAMLAPKLYSTWPFLLASAARLLVGASVSRVPLMANRLQTSLQKTAGSMPPTSPKPKYSSSPRSLVTNFLDCLRITSMCTDGGLPWRSLSTWLPGMATRPNAGDMRSAKRLYRSFLDMASSLLLSLLPDFPRNASVRGPSRRTFFPTVGRDSRCK
mmetsp:Transcript_20931/g.49360  ORF Transcript_20931/g.49360 Transcript_20931/m.49360 type:complete len:231 (+) Transcript_20931:831-1523(+)